MKIYTHPNATMRFGSRADDIFTRLFGSALGSPSLYPPRHRRRRPPQVENGVFKQNVLYEMAICGSREVVTVDLIPPRNNELPLRDWRTNIQSLLKGPDVRFLIDSVNVIKVAIPAHQLKVFSDNKSPVEIHESYVREHVDGKQFQNFILAQHYTDVRSRELYDVDIETKKPAELKQCIPELEVAGSKVFEHEKKQYLRTAIPAYRLYEIVRMLKQGEKMYSLNFDNS